MGEWTVAGALFRPAFRTPRASVVYPNRLDIDKLADAIHAEFASVSGVLDAAERQARIGHYHAVHEYLPCLDLVDESRAFRSIVGPHARAETEPGVVSHADGLAGVPHPEQGRDRPEELLRVSRRTRCDVREHRRRVVVARPLERVATSQDACTGGNRTPHLVVEVRERGSRRQRPDFSGRIQWIADLERLHL